MVRPFAPFWQSGRLAHGGLSFTKSAPMGVATAEVEGWPNFDFPVCRIFIKILARSAAGASHMLSSFLALIGPAALGFMGYALYQGTKCILTATTRNPDRTSIAARRHTMASAVTAEGTHRSAPCSRSIFATSARRSSGLGRKRSPASQALSFPKAISSHVESTPSSAPRTASGTYMDGGIDLLYSRHFGWELETNLKALLRELHFGELPVGQAVVLATGHDSIPYLVSAPTMRVPADIADTLNVYLAFRAALIAVHTHNANGAAPIGSLLVPGLGTGIGSVPPERAARQMRAAYSAILEGHGAKPRGARAVLGEHHELLS